MTEEEAGSTYQIELISPKFTIPERPAAEAFADRAYSRYRGIQGEFPKIEYTLSPYHLRIRKEYTPALVVTKTEMTDLSLSQKDKDAIYLISNYS